SYPAPDVRDLLGILLTSGTATLARHSAGRLLRHLPVRLLAQRAIDIVRDLNRTVPQRHTHRRDVRTRRDERGGPEVPQGVELARGQPGAGHEPLHRLRDGIRVQRFAVLLREHIPAVQESYGLPPISLMSMSSVMPCRATNRTKSSRSTRS